mgnify:CR=1 FL=1
MNWRKKIPIAGDIVCPSLCSCGILNILSHSSMRMSSFGLLPGENRDLNSSFRLLRFRITFFNYLIKFVGNLSAIIPFPTLSADFHGHIFYNKKLISPAEIYGNVFYFSCSSTKITFIHGFLTPLL